MEVVASRFFSHSICSLLTAAKRAGGKTKRHCQINLIHPVIESFCLVFFRRERCFIEFEITKRIPMRSFVSGQRSRLRHQPLFRTQIERPVKERVVTAFLVKLFRIRCRNCADPYFAVVASPPLLSGSCDCLAMAALSDLSICLPMSVRTNPNLSVPELKWCRIQIGRLGIFANYTSIWPISGRGLRRREKNEASNREEQAGYFHDRSHRADSLPNFGAWQDRHRDGPGAITPLRSINLHLPKRLGAN